jgi:hypothetical protein
LEKRNKNIKEIKNSNVEISKISQDLNISSNLKSKKILSFAVSFSKMTIKDYKEYLNDTQKTRRELFDRTLNI